MSKDWQPIDTAPKDGTKIDLWADGRATDAFFDGENWKSLDRWQRNKRGGGAVPFYVIINEPTHWMPVPPPPSSDAG